ncbi:hypothetical protein [Streptomyces sp. I6]|nr:hypothetical protein [Streptomyces sp. I6]
MPSSVRPEVVLLLTTLDLNHPTPGSAPTTATDARSPAPSATC